MSTPVRSTISGFHHVAVRAKDLAVSTKFYTEGLGLVEKTRWGSGDSEGAMFDAGDGNYIEVFAGGKTPRPTEAFPEAPILHFALRTTDCVAALERARAAGAEVTKEPTRITIPGSPVAIPVLLAFCKGPDGEVIEFFEQDVT